uniref:MFS domain-containing protein n=1 Tax=Strongyloides papillosus TaxID=174720 RepID=A0A0N5C697_STREA
MFNKLCETNSTLERPNNSVTLLTSNEAKQELGTMIEDVPVKSRVELRTYKIRWIVLLSVAMANPTNTYNWICSESISTITNQYYGNNTLMLYCQEFLLLLLYHLN